MRQILEADGIEFHYGPKEILSGIYISCETGNITGLLGRNGCGKSTLLQIIFGSKRSESGSVRINGSRVNGKTLSRRLIAYLPQDAMLPEYITPEKAMRLFGVDIATIHHHFPEVAHVLQNNPSTLSGGERRLFELLLVLYSPAPFCLLDEPFSGLAPIMIERVAILLHELKMTKGILLSDHLYRQVTAIAPRLYLLANGRTRSINKVEELARYGYVPEEKL